MRYLPDSEQMRSADMHTINEVGIPSLVLMERAALGTVEAMHRRGIDTSRALVVCGSGNNGGDGFAIARLLEDEKDRADVLFAGREESMSAECALQKKIAARAGVKIFTEIPDREYTVIIDAVFGVGLSRDISGRYCDVIRWMNEQKCAKVAVDIPSGVCARTGRILGTAFRADLTAAMACVKAGSELYPGKNYSGETVAVPIGIRTEYFDNNEDVCFTYDREDIASLLPQRKPDSHKGTYGKVLMITGSSGMAGAAYLSARAAYAVGAGLVRICTASDNRPVLQQLLPEAVLSCYDGFDEEQMRELLAWADVVCIGSGLGQSSVSEQIFNYVTDHVTVPCVIDADGLNLLSRDTGRLGKMPGPVIVTPHMKEMSRLTGKSIPGITEDRVASAREFAREYGAVCVLKDSRTVVSEEGRHPFLNLAGNSAMAKAGSGDVLAGVITGLLAQGKDAFQSAAAGVYLHACGGDEARRAKGGYSVLAGDLIEGLERCIAECENGEAIPGQTKGEERK
ncbi:NAD(P)H-hydrate dehydratase [Ruminococcus sp. CLA-AA-H200]|uniref:Bifunctional NAD(P)H-hydrate repair enzyme n=1 Tax=Ruminococcus turbiniformis TaxID=2881258 RepID=A0ABS8FU31_9FIRM|nr:NAD(P)H-hydrate dehydratase [Ruminococcus turbiniformis]MCC2253563.1 NAD(P)H-hydrate dehydratase [Ruminococcus turbiniformis]